MANSSAAPLPNQTAIATVTPAPTGTPVLTRTSPPTPDDVATLKAIETASINALVSTMEPVRLAVYPSADGKWQAEVIRHDCIEYPYPDYTARIAYEQLKLIDLSDGMEITIDDQLQNCDGLGGGGLEGLYWSPGNRYFYFTDWREGQPDGCGNYIVPTIYRYDTLTQASSTVGGGHLSPDKTKLALWEWQKNEIVIWDLDQGEIARIPGLSVGVTLNGQIAWAPDSQSLVYLRTTFDCVPDFGKTYVIRLKLTDRSQELLLEQDAPGFGAVSWDTMEQLTLRDAKNEEWTYNLITRKLNPPP
jgi:hypothetical protein